MPQASQHEQWGGLNCFWMLEAGILFSEHSGDKDGVIKQPNELSQQCLSKMRLDDVFDAIRNDELVLKFGAILLHKLGGSTI